MPPNNESAWGFLSLLLVVVAVITLGLSAVARITL